MSIITLLSCFIIIALLLWVFVFLIRGVSQFQFMPIVGGSAVFLLSFILNYAIFRNLFFRTYLWTAMGFHSHRDVATAETIKSMAAGRPTL